MDPHESWPPVATATLSRRLRPSRWFWPPILLAVPAAIWCGLQWHRATPEPAAAPAHADALALLAEPSPAVMAQRAAEPKQDPGWRQVGADRRPAPPIAAAYLPLGETVDPVPEKAEGPTALQGQHAVGEAVEGAERDDADGLDNGEERPDEANSNVGDGVDDGAPAIADAEDFDVEREPNQREGDSSEAVDNGFWIQVASLRVKEKADRLAAQLRERGHKAQSQAYGEPRAGWWHVVRMGPYLTRMEAEAVRLAFAAQEQMPSMVLPRARGPYYLQLASVRSEPSAATLAEKLRRRGHHAYVRAVATKQGTWHCVRIGPFDSEADALGYQKLLRERDDVEGEILPRPSQPEP